MGRLDKKIYKTVYQDRMEAIGSLDRKVARITWWVAKATEVAKNGLGTSRETP